MRICVAMSGGVDSSATAYMLKKEGHEVFGITMDLLDNQCFGNQSSILDAKRVADQLDIEHHFLDLKKEFRKYIIQYFADSYYQGLTPSPCIICNKEIKLGLLAQKAFELNADLIVTGHYANIIETPERVELHRAKDLIKDQSYFLFAIKKDILQKLRCPLSNLSKDQTRKLALKAGLDIHQKKDSQDICFVQDGKYQELIQNLAPKPSKTGSIIDTSGKILGSHNGIINYTVGQRKGLGIGGGNIYYVTKIDAKNNQIIVGSKEELLQKSLVINNINWLIDTPSKEFEAMVKLRSRQNLVPAQISLNSDNTANITLLEDFYGVAPGQGCCIYQSTQVLGGGFIL